MMSALERLRSYLDRQEVAYQLREHPEAFTIQEIAALEHVAGRRMAKVVMVLAGEQLLMLVLPAPARVDFERLGAVVGGGDLRLAHEEEFAPAFPDCDAGAMPPFGNLYGVPVYVDQALAEDGWIVFQAGTHRHTMELAYADFQRLVEPEVVSLSGAPSQP
jgi:Ala-tRNA(Pro) deacylase